MTSGVKMEVRLCGVCLIMVAISSSTKKLSKSGQGYCKKAFLKVSIWFFSVFFIGCHNLMALYDGSHNAVRHFTLFG